MSNQHPSRPTIVIIGGGWHRPKSYNKLTQQLRHAGHEVFVPPLPSTNGARPPNAGLKDDTALVHDFIESLCEANRRCVVLMHSYGGQVGTNALGDLSVTSRAKRGLAGGVVHLIYMSAFALTEGRSMIDKVTEMGHIDLMPVAFDFADDMTVVSRDPRTLIIGVEASDEEASEYEATWVRWNGGAMYEPIERVAWREITSSYIMCENDMTVPLEYQKSVVDAMRSEGREVETFTINTGHCPNLTATDDVVRIVGEIAGKI